MPEYKYVKKIIVTDEELVKTTTQKIKRHEEMKKYKKMHKFQQKVLIFLQKCSINISDVFNNMKYKGK